LGCSSSFLKGIFLSEKLNSDNNNANTSKKLVSYNAANNYQIYYFTSRFFRPHHG
jgi:hypothetical protein